MLNPFKTRPDYEPQTFFDFSIDPKNGVLTAIDNYGIYGVTYDPADGKMDPQSVAQKEFADPLAALPGIHARPLLGSGITYNPVPGFRLDGSVYDVTDPVSGSNRLYSLQALVDPRGKTAIEGIVSPDEIGWQPVKGDGQFTLSERNVNVSDLLYKYGAADLKNLFFDGNRRPGSRTDVLASGCVVSGIGADCVRISEVVTVGGKEFLGFTRKNGTDPGSGYAAGFASYVGVFKRLVSAIAYFASGADIVKNPEMGKLTVHDLMSEYQSDYAGFQAKYFDAFVTRIENRDPDVGYEVNVVSVNERDNSITLDAIAKTAQGSVVLETNNPGRSGEDRFDVTYDDVFAPYAPTPQPKSDLPLILEITVPIGCVIVLALVFGLAFWRHSRMVARRMALSDRRMEGLIVSFKKVFDRLDEGMRAMGKKGPKLLESKPKKPPVASVPRPIKPLNRPPKPLRPTKPPERRPAE